MTFDTPLGAALFLVALVTCVATAAVTLFRSTVIFERWLDEIPADGISHAQPTSDRRVILDGPGDTRAA
jgi:hypothetical protein